MLTEQDILSRHPYKIWQGPDGLWYTYLPEKDNPPHGRYIIKHENLDILKRRILYDITDGKYLLTVYDLYKQWITQKYHSKKIMQSTKKRTDRYYKRSLQQFGYNKAILLESSDIESFIIKTIKSNHMTRKEFQNMKTILYGIFRLAKNEGLISFDIRKTIQYMNLPKDIFTAAGSQNHSSTENLIKRNNPIRF